MPIEKYAALLHETMEITDFSYELSQSLFGFVLAEELPITVPFICLEFRRPEWKKIFFSKQKELNRNARGAYRIKDEKIVLKKKLRRGLKPFLRNQFACMFTSLDLPITEKFVDIMCSLPHRRTPPEMFDTLAYFYNGVRGGTAFWLRFIGDLLHGEMQCGAELADFYNLSDTNRKFIQWIGDHAVFPALINVHDGKFIVSPAYFTDDTSVLPYLICCMDFHCMYAHKTLFLLYMCLMRNKAE